LVAILAIVGAYAAMPQLGRWVTTANASASPADAATAVNGPLNDNDDDACSSGDPRKQKRCHYNQPDFTDDNDNDTADAAPVLYISVSNADPGDGDTFTLTLRAVGQDVDQVWWWASDVALNDDNGNDNGDDSGLASAHFLGCDGNEDCTVTAEITVNNASTITIYAKARDSAGRESPEVATQVRVHD